MTTGGLIDRERVSDYSLTVMACHTDSAPADRCSNNISLSFAVNVVDANDNSPQFDRDTYSTTLRGDESIGSRVLQLTATDADASRLNSLVTYRLDSVAPVDSLGGPLFAVDALSGWLTVAGRLTDVDGQVVVVNFSEIFLA